jgi:two-component system NtrC family sensor kinase
LIRDSSGLATQNRHDTDKIINAALHAREVIRKLTIYTRQTPAQKVGCDLSKLVREGLFFLESRCAKEGIVMERRLEDRLPQIMADPSQMYQVLVNLGVNAIQAMPGGGRLTISTRRFEKSVCLVVEDTGTGMDEEVQKQLFRPFFTTKDVGQGTGLGLAVVQGIVNAHGGTIEVTSETGKGSSFEIRFPVEDSAPQQ